MSFQISNFMLLVYFSQCKSWNSNLKSTKYLLTSILKRESSPFFQLILIYYIFNLILIQYRLPSSFTLFQIQFSLSFLVTLHHTHDCWKFRSYYLWNFRISLLSNLILSICSKPQFNYFYLLIYKHKLSLSKYVSYILIWKL